MGRGDVLFYRNDGSLISQLIVWRTGGPEKLDCIHVGVDDGNGQMIDATSRYGVSRHPRLAAAAIFHTSEYSSKVGINRGMAFLHRQVDSHADYGWLDDLSDLLPSWWPILVENRHAFSCSHLVMGYLIACAVPAGRLDGIPAATVTPNDLYRTLILQAVPVVPAAAQEKVTA